MSFSCPGEQIPQWAGEEDKPDAVEEAAEVEGMAAFAVRPGGDERIRPILGRLDKRCGGHNPLVTSRHYEYRADEEEKGVGMGEDEQDEEEEVAKADAELGVKFHARGKLLNPYLVRDVPGYGFGILRTPFSFPASRHAGAIIGGI